MATAAPPPLLPTTIEPPLWPISVAMFAEMVRAGLIGEKERVYLWRGRLARRMPPNRPHSNAVWKAHAALSAILPDGFFAEPEQPMALRFEPSAPEPDVKVLRGKINDYPRDYPTTSDVVLVVEVADSSLNLDREMAAIYAREEIPVYWLVNIPDGVIEVHTDPRPARGDMAAFYANVAIFGPGTVVPVVIDGGEIGRIAVADLLS